VLADVIAGKASPARNFFWRARRGDRTWRAIRSGPWKWIGREDAGEQAEWLFELDRDPTESTDEKAAHPAEVERLKKRVAEWETEVRPVR
jgi:N-acetylgalactosamine-6-sulfatase